MDEFMTRDQRTRKRQNYMEDLSPDNVLYESIDDIGPSYDKAFIPDDTTEELPSFIVDYANLIRNDIILLDKSVETRTRKRGNIKVEKHDQVIPESPCSCELKNDTKDLGENTYPRYIEYRICSDHMCRDDYICIPKEYHITILKRRTSTEQNSKIDLPSDLKHQWIAEKRPVVIGCMCTRDYIIEK
ncbi:prothoracicotropic hormone [Achroia grisella]|uniref:prothoracicotropic hormone n=1 Tax=Achroia grisella TaxID=688607 RepID=UPI0027D2CD1D|nr:prothoracicotropic hormone [Achroia grisella]